MRSGKSNIATKLRHIEWHKNLGIVVAKRLTSPLILGCIEMRSRRNSQNIIGTTSISLFTLTSTFLRISIHRARIVLGMRGTRCDGTFGILKPCKLELKNLA